MRTIGKSYEDHYVRQIGQGMPVYSGAYMQRGHGLGNVGKTLWKTATPLLKTIGKQVVKRGTDVLKSAGKQALKQGLMTAATELGKRGPGAAILQSLVGPSRKPRKTRKRVTSRKRATSRKNDIFSR